MDDKVHSNYKRYQFRRFDNPSSDLRLIDISNDSSANDGIFCYIRTYAFNECPSYEALSYAWGDNTQKSPISLVEATGNTLSVIREFEVTVNLYSALKNLRKRRRAKANDERMLIWVDALCIDQTSLEERNEQVQRMKSIYQNARRVIVYLGDYYEPIDGSIAFSKEIWGIDSLGQGSYSLTLSAITVALHLSSLRKIASAKETTQVLDELSRPEESEGTLSNIYAWAHLSRLFNRPWFERLWVLQEIGVSKEALLLCGGLEISWAIIADAAAFILRPHPVTPAAILKFLPLMRAHRMIQVTLNGVSDISKSNLLSVLRHTQRASCSDPRDKLYAILGVTEDIQDVQIDYSKTVEEVYRDWAVRRILRTNSLDILSACANSGRTAGIPSWVPDLRRPWADDKALWFLSQQRSKDLGRPTRSSQMQIPPYMIGMPWNHGALFWGNNLQLVLKGSLIGEIVSLSSIVDAVENLHNPAELTARLLEIVADWEAWYGQGHAPSAPEERRFVMTMLRESHPQNVSSSCRFEEYRFWRDPAQLWRDLQIGDFERQLFSLLHGAQMFMTRTGNIGVVAGNCAAQIGDELYFLSGGFTPFILRKVFEKHRLISPCYFYDHMLPRNVSQADLKLETVTLI